MLEGIENGRLYFCGGEPPHPSSEEPAGSPLLSKEVTDSVDIEEGPLRKVAPTTTWHDRQRVADVAIEDAGPKPRLYEGGKKKEKSADMKTRHYFEAWLDVDGAGAAGFRKPALHEPALRDEVFLRPTLVRSSEQPCQAQRR
ncbi:MAG: hypothetical protein NVS9B14_14920 [Candidatus Acidiferrum sp.]